MVVKCIFIILSFHILNYPNSDIITIILCIYLIRLSQEKNKEQLVCKKGFTCMILWRFNLLDVFERVGVKN